MDLGFHTRRGKSVAPAGRLDFHAIVAALAAAQGRGRTARAAALIGAAPIAMLPRDTALMTLFLGQPGWVDAAADLGGSFDASLAAGFRHAAVKDTDQAFYPAV